ncbi:MAG: hypothetical protein AAGA30_08335 [Planctomycetota bacterium]
MFRSGISLLVVFLTMACIAVKPFDAQAQITTNVVDLDLTEVIQCNIPDEEPLKPLICNVLLECFVDQLNEAESFLDQVFTGYRNDMPAFLRNQLDEPVLIQVVMDSIDGKGMVLAQAGPRTVVNLLPNPFLRLRGGFRGWSIPRTGTMTFDIDDIPCLVLSDSIQDVCVHEAFHALGHPNLFEIAGLNDASNVFGNVNFVGDVAGINGVGYGLTEFRQESGNPLATFIPLSLDDGSGHLSIFEPTFVRIDEGFQEVFVPSISGGGIQAFMSRSLQGMYADLGFQIRGINGPGFIDLDGDLIEDNPLVINPVFEVDCDASNNDP